MLDAAAGGEGSASRAASPQLPQQQEQQQTQVQIEEEEVVVEEEVEEEEKQQQQNQPPPAPAIPPPAIPPPAMQRQQNGSGHVEQQQLTPDTLLIDGPQATECVVCWERLRVIAFVPCGHICVCELCFTQQKADRKNSAGKENKTDGQDLCHICRAEVTGHLRVYLP